MLLPFLFIASDEYERKIESLRHRMFSSFMDLSHTVSGILKEVKNNGDDALIDITARYDDMILDKRELRISDQEIESAFADVESEYIDALHEAIENIYYFHEKQLHTSWLSERNGVILGHRISPLEKVGIYVPHHSPSAVLMNAIPAKVAGVRDLIMVTPPYYLEIDPHILVAAREVDIENIFRIGGAQAIGALAFGTETIPSVDKIIGPGDVYINLAKQQVYGLVDIDLFTGPSELAIIADDTASPIYIAADLLAQAENGEMSCEVLITPYEQLAKEVLEHLKTMLEDLPRKRIAKKSLEEYGIVIITENMMQAVQVANDLAPAHLQIMTADPWEEFNQIKHAGQVYLGVNSPHIIGKSFAGSNSVVPTGGTPRFHSPLGIDDFLKHTEIVYYTRKQLEKDRKTINRLAELEQLDAHIRSIDKRFE